jgi:signal transduction histidine kinase
VASVTGFAHRYKRDTFYRTGWNVLFLQVGFAIVLVGISLVSLSFLYDEIIAGLIEAITRSIASGANPAGDSAVIAASLEYEKQKNMVLAATGILVAAAVFSWLIMSIALRPTKRALESQKQFVGNIAHELRTPLSILKTNTEVALFNQSLDRGARDSLVSNLEELDRVSDIINNLLSMNALLNPERVVFVNVDLGPVIERVTRSLSEFADQKKIEISSEAGSYQTVRGNAAALEQILMNVVKNAINYTRPGGSVTIRTVPDYRGHVEIEVSDTGIGIPEKDLEHVFEPFYRGDKARTRVPGGGTGLGLAIVGELVRSHKGRIRLTSVEGRGTTVYILLPCGKDEPSEVHAPLPTEPSVHLS